MLVSIVTMLVSINIAGIYDISMPTTMFIGTAVRTWRSGTDSLMSVVPWKSPDHLW